MSKKWNYYGWWYGWYYGWYSYWGWGWSTYQNSYWNDVYSRYASSFSTAEEKRAFKKKIIEESRKRYFPTEITVNNSKTEFFKKRRMEININTSDMAKMKWKESIIVDAFQKFPYNSDIWDSEAFRWYLTKDAWNLSNYLNWSSWVNNGDMIIWYFEWRVTYADYRKIFKDISAMKSESKVESNWGWKWGREVWSKEMLQKDLYKKNLRIIQSKIRSRSITSQEESLRKGKRINRNFINGTSYKPLMDKTVETSKRKKVMFILDCSGSMGRASKVGSPQHGWISFIAAAVNSWVFDCEHVIYHSDSWWENVIREIRKEDLFGYYGGWEGFEHIDDNLEKDWLNWVDYVVTVTDLCIWSSAQQWLYDYLKKAKKHMILSFENWGKLKWMNVRVVKTPANMINSLVTMTST